MVRKRSYFETERYFGKNEKKAGQSEQKQAKHLSQSEFKVNVCSRQLRIGHLVRLFGLVEKVTQDLLAIMRRDTGIG